uniref:SCAN box domain-containing protein n=1 Tax=Crocodylus porosus TaxID=8502 RepID=A0A7M4DX71_CROPO
MAPWGLDQVRLGGGCPYLALTHLPHSCLGWSPSLPAVGPIYLWLHCRSHWGVLGVPLGSPGDLLNKWLKPKTATKEDICDQILLEQFITDFEEGTQRWVRCHCPKSSCEALQLAEDFNMAQGETHQDREHMKLRYHAFLAKGLWKII